jgi:hypothetical protein
MEASRVAPLTALTVLTLFAAAFVAATVPGDWSTNGFHVPACSASVNVKHFELLVSPQDPSGLVTAYDTMKAKGFTNLQYRFIQTGEGVWSGDCSLAT